MNDIYVPTNPEGIRWVIWDVGGPIYERNGMLEQAVAHEFHKAIAGSNGYDIETARQLYEEEYGKTRKARESLIKLAGKDCLDECMDAVDPTPHLPEDPELQRFIFGLRDAGIGLIALTNGPRAFTEKVIRAVIGQDPFSHILAAEDLKALIGEVKPSPDVFRYAMEVAGNDSPQAYLSIGDEPTKDLDPAIEVGMQAYLFHRGDIDKWRRLQSFFEN